MSEQNIIPSAPPLYPSLQRESVGDYRLKKISDCQKELENEISYYRRISKKYENDEKQTATHPRILIFFSALCFDLHLF